MQALTHQLNPLDHASAAMRRRVVRLTGGAALGAACSALWAERAAAAQGATGGHAQAEGGAQPPQRIVSLLPSLTETVCALGACDRLVGVDRWSNWPASVRALPQLGGQDDLPIEALLRLRPDAVLAPRSARATDRLRSLGLQVWTLEPETLADTYATFREVAHRLGMPAAGERLVQDVAAQLQAAAARMPLAWRGQRVYLEVASTPHAASAGSFVGEVLTQLGLRHIIDARLGPFPQLNPEAIVRADPQLIIVPAHTVTTLAQRPGWQRIAAIRAGHVIGLAPADWDALIRPGPRLGAAAHQLIDQLIALSR